MHYASEYKVAFKFNFSKKERKEKLITIIIVENIITTKMKLLNLKKKQIFKLLRLLCKIERKNEKKTIYEIFLMKFKYKFRKSLDSKIS